MGAVQRYQNRISGPLMDRIDLHVEVARVPFAKLAGLAGGEPSRVIRARVEGARKVQAMRYGGWSKKELLVNGLVVG